jgi:hypothetical protein
VPDAILCCYYWLFWHPTGSTSSSRPGRAFQNAPRTARCRPGRPGQACPGLAAVLGALLGLPVDIGQGRGRPQSCPGAARRARSLTDGGTDRRASARSARRGEVFPPSTRGDRVRRPRPTFGYPWLRNPEPRSRFCHFGLRAPAAADGLEVVLPSCACRVGVCGDECVHRCIDKVCLLMFVVEDPSGTVKTRANRLGKIVLAYDLCHRPAPVIS